MTSLSFNEISKRAPEKSLLDSVPNKAGRDGRISVRRRGGKQKRLYRIIDFKRDKIGVPGVVATVEYDPNRSANIALIHYRDGEKRYILAPKGLRIKDTICSGEDIPATPGNHLVFSKIALGTVVHNVEINLGKGGQLVRSAGVGAVIVSKENGYVTLRLPSSEVRKISDKCSATIGVIGNEDVMNVKLGKAGRARHRGRRPKVRGVVMNPVDHPHGGGEGRTSGGRHPVSPTGVPAKGYRTRKKRKYSSKFIVKRRSR